MTHFNWTFTNETMLLLKTSILCQPAQNGHKSNDLEYNESITQSEKKIITMYMHLQFHIVNKTVNTFTSVEKKHVVVQKNPYNY